MDRRTFISRAIRLTMGSALSEAYAMSSGEVLEPGRYHLPRWVPAVGVVADVSLNTMFDVRGSDPDSSMQYNYWSGTAYAKEYGENGSLIFNAGGHTATLTNYVYGYDVATRMHFMERQSTLHYQAADGYVADTVTGWLWADKSGTTVQEGETFAFHSYSFMTYLPPTSISGGRAPYGWLFTPGRASMCAGGQKGTRQAHKLALGLGLNTPYEMHGSPVPHNANFFLRCMIQHGTVLSGLDILAIPIRGATFITWILTTRLKVYTHGRRVTKRSFRITASGSMPKWMTYI